MRYVATDRYGSFAACHHPTSSPAGIGCKADVRKEITGSVAVRIKTLLRISQHLACVGAVQSLDGIQRRRGTSGAYIVPT